MNFPVLCIDATVQLINFEPVQEHTVVLQEGEVYNVIDTFYMGQYLFYILEGKRNAYDSTMFIHLQNEKLLRFMTSEYYETILNDK